MRMLLLVMFAALVTHAPSVYAQVTQPELSLAFYPATVGETWVTIVTPTDSTRMSGVQVTASVMSREPNGIRALAPIRIAIAENAELNLRVASENPCAILKLITQGKNAEAVEMDGSTFTISRDLAGPILITGPSARRVDSPGN